MKYARCQSPRGPLALTCVGGLPTAGRCMACSLWGRRRAILGVSVTTRFSRAEVTMASTTRRSRSPSSPSGSGRRPSRTHSTKYTSSAANWSLFRYSFLLLRVPKVRCVTSPSAYFCRGVRKCSCACRGCRRARRAARASPGRPTPRRPAWHTPSRARTPARPRSARCVRVPLPRIGAARQSGASALRARRWELASLSCVSRLTWFVSSIGSSSRACSFVAAPFFFSRRW